MADRRADPGEAAASTRRWRGRRGSAPQHVCAAGERRTVRSRSCPLDGSGDQARHALLPRRRGRGSAGRRGFEPHPRKDKEDCVTCCAECGCEHPALVDEYYFWLVDGAFYQPPATPVPTSYTSADRPGHRLSGRLSERFLRPVAAGSGALAGHDATAQAALTGRRSPMVRLAWCRVHNGEFQQPRQSDLRRRDQPGAKADLIFLGRNCRFAVLSRSATPCRRTATPIRRRPASATTWRRTRPCLLPRPISARAAHRFPGRLPAYPYFLYDTPGTHLFPLSAFSPAMAVARTLRAHCRFEAALNWYRLAFDPLQRDCTWIDARRSNRRHHGAEPAGGRHRARSAAQPGRTGRQRRPRASVQGNPAKLARAATPATSAATNGAAPRDRAALSRDAGGVGRRRPSAGTTSPEAFRAGARHLRRRAPDPGPVTARVRCEPNPRHRRPSRISCRLSRRSTPACWTFTDCRGPAGADPRRHRRAPPAQRPARPRHGLFRRRSAARRVAQRRGPAAPTRTAGATCRARTGSRS